MDIEERAEKWAREYLAQVNDLLPSPPGRGPILKSADLIAAYLAGSAQTQADYTAAIPGAQDEGWRDYWDGKPKLRD